MSFEMRERRNSLKGAPIGSEAGELPDTFLSSTGQVLQLPNLSNNSKIMGSLKCNFCPFTMTRNHCRFGRGFFT